VLAQLQRAFEMPQFHAEPRQRCKRVDDESTPVAGVVTALVGIRPRLDRTVDADGVIDILPALKREDSHGTAPLSGCRTVR